MDFATVDAAIDACKRHLDALDRQDPLISSFLVQFLLVLICSAYENELKRLIGKKAEQAGNPHVESFVKSATERVFRSLRISEVSGLLGRFDQDLKREFSARIEHTEAHTSWDSILNDRHDLAHGRRTTNLTFGELCDYYSKSKLIVETFGDVLGV